MAARSDVVRLGMAGARVCCFLGVSAVVSLLSSLGRAGACSAGVGAIGMLLFSFGDGCRAGVTVGVATLPVTQLTGDDAVVRETCMAALPRDREIHPWKTHV